ncbi:MAG: DUF29 domain-containing protein [Pseudanabaena sp. CAN_BIN31]|nr:DUF29 domain-containing protein [Pseudanabaena sp. CAN_BIN31]
MTIAIVPKTSLYEIDYLLWIQETVDKLKVRDFDHLDIENLIEEIESLGISQKKEVRNRLRVLLEHLVKRIYIDMPDCFEGWENTIRTQRNDIKDELVDMPSLKRFWDEFFDRAWQRALLDVRGEYAKKGYQFPDTWQFNHDIDSMLNVDFWLF